MRRQSYCSLLQATVHAFGKLETACGSLPQLSFCCRLSNMDDFHPIPTKIWLPITFFFIFLQLSSQSEPPSFYDYLRESRLPAGVFPQGITDFSLEPKTGRFTVTLPCPCNALFEKNHRFHFDFNISGVLSDGQIGELSGVSQQELFLWFPVKRIRLDPQSSGLIHFDVGVDKQLSISLFESPPDCVVADDSDIHPIDPSQFDGIQDRSGEIQSISGPRNAVQAVL